MADRKFALTESDRRLGGLKPLGPDGPRPPAPKGSGTQAGEDAEELAAMRLVAQARLLKIERLQEQLLSCEEAISCFLRTWKRAGPLGSHQFEKFDTAVRLCEIAAEKLGLG